MAAPQQTTIAFGKYRLTGWPAQIVLAALVIGIAAWIAYLRPSLDHWPMWVSIAGWIAFTSYWSAAAKNSAEAQSFESAESRRVHELLVNIGLVLLFVPVPGLRELILPRSLLWIVGGLGLQAACFALAVWARRHLGRNWSGRIEIKVDHQLIRSGPYRSMRHPIYTAMVGMYLGSALAVGQVHSFIGVAIVAFGYWRKLRIEEAKLSQVFGAKWQDYRRKTWALVPGVF